MSEYQYHELAAIDRPLSVDEQADLRAISTRALITPTSFVNHYERRDLKADPRRLVERHFDAFLYLANWGTHRLTFRLPVEAFGASATAVAERYLVGDCSTTRTTGGHVIIDLFAEDDGGEYVEEWNREVDEDEVEPRVPPGLGQLSAALSAVAEFLRIDRDLVAVAAERSFPAGVDDTLTQLPGWLAQLPLRTKDAWLVRIARGDGVRVRAELLAGCWRVTSPVQAADVARRTAGEGCP